MSTKDDLVIKIATAMRLHVEKVDYFHTPELARIALEIIKQEDIDKLKIYLETNI